jgi:hypothetical protein
VSEPSFQQEISIDVKAGQTLVLEIVARNASQSGGFDITVTSGGSIPEVVLVGTTGYYRLPLRANEGRLEGITPGTYTLTLTPPAQGTELHGTVSYPKVV